MRLHWINPCGLKSRSIALGTFDGVHCGHQALLKKTVEKRPQLGCATAFTFDIPPEQMFRQERQLICAPEDKHRLILAQGLDEIVWVEFNKEFSIISAERFIMDILVRALRASQVVCGFNFRFGHRAEGTPEMLEEFGRRCGFQVDVVPPQKIDGNAISSTRIRHALRCGDLAMAQAMLGRRVSYRGTVVPGARRGRRLGFPTANLAFSPDILLPKDGVYSALAYLSDRQIAYPAVTSISNNPTFHGQQKTVEAYILDFSGDLYGQILQLEFVDFIRDIRKFPDGESLRVQIEEDVRLVRAKLGSERLQQSSTVIE